MDDLCGAEKAKHCVQVWAVGHIAGVQPHIRRQIYRLMSGMHLRVQDIHYRDVMAGFDQAPRKRGSDESSAAGDEHGS
ncbi:hypothetical protein MMOR_50140 [Mycolicibacterium moriokaense]|uniref:Uncharacterized protein n=1 Tax=Mycolicibacterium moriokaense TaxID=39691 RepID=A0AAD1HEQ2_9MYCO|nr:hypothetical protein MMOR_50140 [Mycolicibacterium moriokaense]